MSRSVLPVQKTPSVHHGFLFSTFLAAIVYGTGVSRCLAVHSDRYRLHNPDFLCQFASHPQVISPRLCRGGL